ncbi:MAG: hypothetical protein IT566_03460, partial [Rhodospirillaceae bacterium]|nr:hypothetical protein [Rhodospirillaceae bacterium]
MKLLMFTCARGFSVDQGTNAVSLFNVVERIASPGFPCGLPELHIIAVARCKRAGPHLPLRLDASLNKNTLFEAPFEMLFSEDGRARGFGRISGFPLLEPGDLCFALWRGNQKIAEWQIELMESAPDIEDLSG